MALVTMLKNKRACLKPWEQPTLLEAGQSYELNEELATCLVNEKSAKRAAVKDKALRGAPHNKAL